MISEDVVCAKDADEVHTEYGTDETFNHE
jgi:hypothetical protein